MNEYKITSYETDGRGKSQAGFSRPSSTPLTPFRPLDPISIPPLIESNPASSSRERSPRNVPPSTAQKLSVSARISKAEKNKLYCANWRNKKKTERTSMEEELARKDEIIRRQEIEILYLREMLGRQTSNFNSNHHQQPTRGWTNQPENHQPVNGFHNEHFARIMGK